MLVIGQAVGLRRWKDNQPETITDHPLPDPAELNAAIPRLEWEIGLDGNPRPPWRLTYATYFVELTSGTLHTFANSTFGTKLAYEQLEEQIAVVRMLRNEPVYPIANLDKKPMKTRFGMKTRPHFQVVDWRAPGTGSPLAAQSSSPQLTGPAPTAAASIPPATPTALTMPTAPASPAAATLERMKPVAGYSQRVDQRRTPAVGLTTESVNDIAGGA